MAKVERNPGFIENFGIYTTAVGVTVIAIGAIGAVKESAPLVTLVSGVITSCVGGVLWFIGEKTGSINWDNLV